MRGLLAGLTGLVHDRLALLGTELREEVVRARWMVVHSLSAVLLGALGLAFAGLALVMSVAETYRPVAAAGIAVLFAGGAGYAVWRARCSISKRQAFSASLAELERDRSAFAERSQAERKSLADASRQILSIVSIGLMAYDIARRLKR